MEDSFNCRVDKIFGSLLGSSSSSSSSSSCPWTLSDAEIERKQWNRDKGDSDLSPDTYQQRTPSSSSSSSVFNGFFSSEQINNNSSRKPSGSKKSIEDDLEDIEDDDVDEDEKEKERDRPEEDCDKEELEIRNGIGTDCTLDYEVRVLSSFVFLFCFEEKKYHFYLKVVVCVLCMICLFW